MSQGDKVKLHVEISCHCGNDLEFDSELWAAQVRGILPGTVIKANARIRECHLCKTVLVAS